MKLGKQFEATCANCGAILVTRQDTSMKGASELMKLDKIALCCNHPDYWTKEINEIKISDGN